ncbi:MAG: archease [Acidobacteria bacterium]|nr:archease [Acidobacteriota bacterium]
MVPEDYERPSGRFEYFDHAADLGIRAAASSVPELFVMAGRALMAWMGPAPPEGEISEHDLSLQADDLEDLLVRWLQELLYFFTQRHAYFIEAREITVDRVALQARLRCRHWDETDYERFQEVKAITYHKLRIAREESGWSAQVIVDV